MSQIFCPSCGTKNPFANGRKPNFCMGCGHDFQSLAVFGGEKSQATASGGRAMDVDVNHGRSSGRGNDGGFGDDVEGEITKDDIEIVQDMRGKFKLSSIAGTSGQGHEDARQPLNSKAKKVNGKKLFEVFKTEAGAGGAKRLEIGVSE